MWRFDAVVVSDLHLGAGNSRTDDFLRFLASIDTRRLILNGDLFDSPRLQRLAAPHVAVLRALRAYGRSADVVWLQGNHDPSADWFEGVLGIHAQREYLLTIGGRRYLICHGDQWDDSLQYPWPLVDAADALYRGCQWLDPSHGLARQLKYGSKRFLSVVEQLRLRAVEHARRASFDGVILGHTHVLVDARGTDVHYLNCGCWTERPASFVAFESGRPGAFTWDARAGELALRDATSCGRRLQSPSISVAVG
jgi:UDP-2,3-diacylglucosamine pyrophosphatase LpxH